MIIEKSSINNPLDYITDFILSKKKKNMDKKHVYISCN